VSRRNKPTGVSRGTDDLSGPEEGATGLRRRPRVRQAASAIVGTRVGHAEVASGSRRSRTPREGTHGEPLDSTRSRSSAQPRPPPANRSLKVRNRRRGRCLAGPLPIVRRETAAAWSRLISRAVVLREERRRTPDRARQGLPHGIGPRPGQRQPARPVGIPVEDRGFLRSAARASRSHG